MGGDVKLPPPSRPGPMPATNRRSPFATLRLCSVSVGLMLLAGCLALRPDLAGAPPVAALRSLGDLWARLVDLPWSPLHLLLGGLGPAVPPGLHATVAAFAATAYGLSLLMVLTFAVALRGSRWPGQAAAAGRRCRAAPPRLPPRAPP